MTKVAMCRNCEDEPLVMTFAFPGVEFICLGCGNTYAFFGPASAPETPELLAKLEERIAQWLPIGRDLLCGGAMLRDCVTCTTNGEPHISHATAAEIAAHMDALAEVAKLRKEPV